MLKDTKFFRNKKADANYALNILIGFIIAVVVLLVLMSGLYLTLNDNLKIDPSDLLEGFSEKDETTQNINSEDTKDTKDEKNLDNIEKIFGGAKKISSSKFTKDCKFTNRIVGLNNPSKELFKDKLGMKFLNIVNEFSFEHDFNKREFLAIIALETQGTFSPCILSHIGAIGLIQFTETTAKALRKQNKGFFINSGFSGSPSIILSKMTREKQMEAVKLYFKGKSGLSRDDAYLIIFTGSIPKTDIVYESREDGYKNNPHLDKYPKDGKITKKEIKKFLDSWQEKIPELD